MVRHFGLQVATVLVPVHCIAFKGASHSFIYPNVMIATTIPSLRAKVGAIGPRADLTYEYEHLGDSASALASLVTATSGFGAALKAAQRPIVLLGAGAFAGKDSAAVAAAAKAVASAAQCVTPDWNGYGVLQSAAAAAGALDIGFVPGPTAAPLNALKAVYLLGADEIAFDQLLPSAFVIYQVNSTHIS